jgi:hypothetical protein
MLAVTAPSLRRPVPAKTLPISMSLPELHGLSSESPPVEDTSSAKSAKDAKVKYV